jgi:hypothetical protein
MTNRPSGDAFSREYDFPCSISHTSIPLIGTYLNPQDVCLILSLNCHLVDDLGLCFSYSFRTVTDAVLPNPRACPR